MTGYIKPKHQVVNEARARKIQEDISSTGVGFALRRLMNEPAEALIVLIRDLHDENGRLRAMLHDIEQGSREPGDYTP